MNNNNKLIPSPTNKVCISAVFMLAAILLASCGEKQQQVQLKERKTKVTIVGDQFYINDVPTYQGRTWTTTKGDSFSVEGLLMNSRMVQGIFDRSEERRVGKECIYRW